MSVTNTKPHDGDFWATPKEFKESIHWNLSIFPISEIPVFTDFGTIFRKKDGSICCQVNKKLPSLHIIGCLLFAFNACSCASIIF